MDTEDSKWRLLEISDYIFLLDDDSGKTILEKRLKKDRAALETLRVQLEALDKAGENAVSFARTQTRHLKKLGNAPIGLNELKIRDTLWRVLVLLAGNEKYIIILDVCLAHQASNMSKEIADVEWKRKIAVRLANEKFGCD